MQWLALLILLLGVLLVQQADPSSKSLRTLDQNRQLGFLSALGAALFTGFAGVFLEKILKSSDVSVWVRNIQLSLVSLPLALCTAYVNDGTELSSKGFFYGYDFFVCFLILLNAVGGLTVAMVVKHADNILKCFATSLATLILSISSIYLFNLDLSLQFILGVILVLVSSFLYNYRVSPPIIVD